MSKPKLVFATKYEAKSVYWFLVDSGMKESVDRMWDTFDDEYAMHVNPERVRREHPEVYDSWSKR